MPERLEYIKMQAFLGEPFSGMEWILKQLLSHMEEKVNEGSEAIELESISI